MEQNQIVIYQTKAGQTQIDVRLENENVWLNVSQMSALFDREESNVRRHVQNAFKEGELEKDENNVHFLHVNGVKKPVPFYSLQTHLCQMSDFSLFGEGVYFDEISFTIYIIYILYI